MLRAYVRFPPGPGSTPQRPDQPVQITAGTSRRTRAVGLEGVVVRPGTVVTLVIDDGERQLHVPARLDWIARVSGLYILPLPASERRRLSRLLRAHIDASGIIQSQSGDEGDDERNEREAGEG